MRWLFMLLVLSAPCWGAWDNGYTYRRSITIDHTKVPNTDQSNFPVGIIGTYAYLATTGNGGNVTNANGYDIVFTSDSAGASLLGCEQAVYTAASGLVEYYVKVATASHTADTVIYLFYGNAGVSTAQCNGTGAWDSNYKAVYHFGDGTTLSLADSIGVNNGTNHGGTAGTGKVAGGLALAKASTQWVDIGAGASLNITGALTITAWAKTADAFGVGVSGRIVDGSNPSSPFTGYLFYFRAAENGLYDYFNGTTFAHSTNTANDGVFHHLGVTVDGTTARLFKDGATNGTPADGFPGAYSGSKAIGSSPGGVANTYFNGVLDEIRISATQRSDDWIATEYASTSSPSTFYAMEASAETNAAVPIRHRVIQSVAAVPPQASQWLALGLPAWPLMHGQTTCLDPANVAVNGGNLELTIEGRSSTCSDTNLDGSPKGTYTLPYTGGMVISRDFHFLFGTLEFRAKFPAMPGAYRLPWSAVWLLGTNCQITYPHSLDDLGGCVYPGVGTAYQEIDFPEFGPFGISAPTSVTSPLIVVHNPGVGSHVSATPTITDANANWHVYKMIWSSGALEFDIDGTSVQTVTGSMVPSEPMFLLIDTIVTATGSPNPTPGKLILDYIQVTAPEGGLLFRDDFTDAATVGR